ncbi:MAG TPA: DEAD/DEAH box helicase, partial [Polyangiaceae bacterium]|nr:DEAD/DEAH box helicase [Polyangiaceae bacterium]
VIFDEASQVTVPLAVMAMRVGTRFVFIGDDKQLPPVLLSRSVLDDDAGSVFGKFSFRDAEHAVTLDETHRMNRSLTAWPSTAYYQGALQSVERAASRSFTLERAPARFEALLSPEHSAVFVPTLDIRARARNDRDAQLVGDLCETAHASGLALDEMAVVTPFRAQGRAVRRELARRFGHEHAKLVVADTVERMQGQERELIILTLAAGDQAYLGAISSFFFQPERLNVSITRARTKLIVIGPEPERLPQVDEPKVQAWIHQYASMIQQCFRVTL